MCRSLLARTSWSPSSPTSPGARDRDLLGGPLHLEGGLRYDYFRFSVVDDRIRPVFSRRAVPSEGQRRLLALGLGMKWFIAVTGYLLLLAKLWVRKGAVLEPLVAVQ